jgi:uncharacterized phage protein gp47/JayE
MPLDKLAGKLVIPSRDQRIALYKRAISARVPIGNTPPDMRPGSKVDLDARATSDVAGSIDANSITIAKGVRRSTATGQDLYDWATILGTTAPLPAVGGSGAAINQGGSSSGATIFAGDVLTHLPTGLQFQCTQTGLYLPANPAIAGSGTPIPITGIDTGLQTNLPADSVLTWASPRPGSSLTCNVVIQSNGQGLVGGAPVETDDQVRRRLDYLAANPPASGNDAQYQALLMSATTIPIEQAFTIPDAMGPGTTAVFFTLRPGQPGASRIPTATHLALAAQLLGGQMPATDGIFMCTIVASPVTVVLEILWNNSADSWADTTTFPPYLGPIATNGVVASANAAGSLTALAFRLSSPELTAATAPQVGQNIAFLDLPNLTFRQKKILTVTVISTTTYDITVDTTNGISDTSYTPIAGQACCPWSPSLNDALAPVVSYFDTIGPGEQFATFFDPGLRQKRSPANPQYWPSSITNRLLGGTITNQPPQGAQQTQPPVPTLFSTDSIADVLLEEPTVPYAAPTGTPGVFVYLLTLGNLVVFPGG